MRHCTFASPRIASHCIALHSVRQLAHKQQQTTNCENDVKKFSSSTLQIGRVRSKLQQRPWPDFSFWWAPIRSDVCYGGGKMPAVLGFVWYLRYNSSTTLPTCSDSYIQATCLESYHDMDMLMNRYLLQRIDNRLPRVLPRRHLTLLYRNILHPASPSQSHILKKKKKRKKRQKIPTPTWCAGTPSPTTTKTGDTPARLSRTCSATHTKKEHKASIASHHVL